MAKVTLFSKVALVATTAFSVATVGYGVARSHPAQPLPVLTPEGSAKGTCPAGALAICRDGYVWYGASRRGACSRHNGVAQWCPK